MSSVDLNPQPLPPVIDLAALTEAVTASVRRALEERQTSAQTPPVFRSPRIIIGVVFEPQALPEAVSEA
jgi:hypothetical protein